MEMCLLFLQVLQKYHNDITVIVKTKSVSLCKTIKERLEERLTHVFHHFAV